MPLSHDDINKIAHLARLEGTSNEAESESLINDIDKILAMLNQINTIDTTDIQPLAHPLVGTRQRLRSDQVSETNVRDALQSIAPNTEAGLFLVPKVIE